MESNQPFFTLGSGKEGSQGGSAVRRFGLGRGRSNSGSNGVVVGQEQEQEVPAPFWQSAVKTFLTKDESASSCNASKSTHLRFEEDEGEEELRQTNGVTHEEEQDAVDADHVAGKEARTIPEWRRSAGQSGGEKKSVKNHYDSELSQQKRREELLASQKQKRDEILDKIRQLDDSCSESEQVDDENDDFGKLMQENRDLIAKWNEEMNEEHKEEVMDTTGVSEEGKRRGRRIPREQFRRPVQQSRPPCRLMLSEWLIEKPDDLAENWVGVFCPVGKRCLVVASRGRTQVFARTTEYLGVFQSLLPGGAKIDYSRDSEPKKQKGVTILDCIWSGDEEMFFVLDIICWASSSYTKCDKEFRQFFQTSKIQETEGLSARNAVNPYPFVPLPSFNCDDIANVAMNQLPPFRVKVDGVLFFHKQSFYFHRTNPLVLWLYLTDFEEKLQITVSPDLLNYQKPHTIHERMVGLPKHLRNGQGQNKGRRNDSKMDTY